MNIILDTNIWISFLLGKSLSVLTNIFKREDIKIYVSDILIKEIQDVVKRTKISKYISNQSVEDLFELIKIRCDFADSYIQRDPNIRDKKDIFILGMAKNIPADLIITGDKDLLILKNFQGTQIITFSEFKERFL